MTTLFIWLSQSGMFVQLTTYEYMVHTCMERWTRTPVWRGLQPHIPNTTVLLPTQSVQFPDSLQTRICSAPKTERKGTEFVRSLTFPVGPGGRIGPIDQAKRIVYLIVTCQMKVSCEALVFIRKFGSRFRRDDLIWFVNDDNNNNNNLCMY